MREKSSQKGSPKTQRRTAIRASISFPPDLYRTLEEIAQQKKVSLLGWSVMPQRSMLPTCWLRPRTIMSVNQTCAVAANSSVGDSTRFGEIGQGFGLETAGDDRTLRGK